MQNLSDLEITHSNEKILTTIDEIVSNATLDGMFLAKLFKYYCHMHNIKAKRHIPFKLINGKQLYNKNKELFDKFAIIVNKNHFDVKRFFQYCVVNGIKEDNIKYCISSPTMLDKYKEHIKQVRLHKKIYKWIIKTVRNIAIECVQKEIYTTKEYLKMLIDNNLIGQYVVSGNISLYYLAAIPNFKNIISKLDYFSKQELHNLIECFDIYHSNANKAFLQEKNIKFNPIDYTDFAIFSYRKKMNKQIT